MEVQYMYKIAVRRAPEGFYWTLLAANGRVLADSEVYQRYPTHIVTKLSRDISKGCECEIVNETGEAPRQTEPAPSSLSDPEGQ
jgi:hypothetical protein